MGSGVVLDKQGFIATNCHVAMDGLDPWQSLEVFMDNVPVGLPAKVVYGDLAQDVAIIKIKADVRLLNPVTLAEKGGSCLTKSTALAIRWAISTQQQREWLVA